METTYLVCAYAGGSILLLQFILALFGGDADADADLDMEVDVDVGDSFFALLSLKTLVAGVTFFGLTGLASTQFGLSTGISITIATVCGLSAIYVVAQIMASLAKLQSRGNLDLSNAAGKEARCYLRIPSRGKGEGRVTVTVQGRSVECSAVSIGPEIPTGATVMVVGLRGGATLEVAVV